VRANRATKFKEFQYKELKKQQNSIKLSPRGDFCTNPFEIASIYFDLTE
jgi:hypothetical protein